MALRKITRKQEILKHCHKSRRIKETTDIINSSIFERLGFRVLPPIDQKATGAALFYFRLTGRTHTIG